MRILLLKILLAIALFLLFNFKFIDQALAAEISTGSVIFNANCASCHIGGANILVEHKTLQKSALSKYLENYDTDPIQTIINQVQKGKSAMPAFKNKLSEQEILEVAAYVFQKSETGW
ncbi:c-type cytochrome [Anabaena sphaerica FACHB-251]|uniref:C-type cytochrome n=1 Tax=Anabaena sphaerica FACHB-251 TaxID=2692883 RepID=A0A926WES5_9NOST|nr:c-type cytochrome [Anabaena sphaerica]MBD2293251.1 c-type cytochrome [Anabaena sphaerica FACHB-251]